MTGAGSELAVAAFAAETGSHLLEGPRTERFRRFCREFDERRFLADLERCGFRWLPRGSADFPRRLRSAHDPPPGLFLRGNAPVELLERPAVAIVGARACSAYGSGVAQSVARELAAAGVVVISGLARGVDAAAHRGALETGTTVAVLGCGIDRDYPSAHAQLAARIAERGLIVSEYPPGVEPAPWRFPARNRIVAALAEATVVVEARERSGALITADLALDEGREVLAVPGEITSALSRGTNALLRLGATPVTGAADVLAAIGIEAVPAVDAGPPAAVTGSAGVVLGLIRDEPAGADELGRRSGLPAAEVARALAELEVAGLVSQTDGEYRGVMITR
ncbi:MAG TPA: DNA-processing protein DprA [Gaiellaceae bacterium]